MDTNVKRREWVKTAAIIFLAVLLVLTFFSNTIMNASLPEVATQQVTQGTINAKIRASGTITANETYNVKLAQSRKIESVKCKVGQAVNAGDVLFVLEAQESDELKAAKTDLEAKALDIRHPYDVRWLEKFAEELEANNTALEILYNLADDVHEDHDVAALYPERVAQLVDIVHSEHIDNPTFRVTLPEVKKYCE